jgi:hypothetical protein
MSIFLKLKENWRKCDTVCSLKLVSRENCKNCYGSCYTRHLGRNVPTHLAMCCVDNRLQQELQTVARRWIYIHTCTHTHTHTHTHKSKQHYLHQVTKTSNPITGLDRPWGFQEVKAPRFLRQSAHEGGKVVSSTHRPPLPPGNILGTHLC